jgi:toxin ParE1/3/4
LKVVITEAAWADMLDIGKTIMADSPARASTFVDELYERCQSIGDNPRAFPLLPNYEVQGVRR